MSRGRRRLGVEAVVMKGKYRGTENEADAGSNKVRGRRGGGWGEAEAGVKACLKGWLVWKEKVWSHTGGTESEN